MKNFIVIIVLLILVSCRKESSYSTTNFICNEANHLVKIIYYKDGLVKSDLTIGSIGSCNLVYTSNGFGKGNASNYLNSTIDMDSAIVIFDNNIKAIHYSYNKIGSNPKAIIFGNSRNIFGGSSSGGWVNRIVSETKHHIETELKYTFIEQDFVEAKK